MLIQIDGWFGSGKGVLWSLLDGHPDIFCSPIHDYSFGAFLSQSDELDWVKTKHVEILRKALARSQYYKFEKVFWDGFWSFSFTADELLKLKCNYDYYKFDYNFIKNLVELESWSIEKIVDTLYTSLHQATFSKTNRAVPELFASSTNPLFINDYKNFPVIYPNGKSVQVRRSVEHIIAIRANRKPKAEDFKSNHFFSGSFEKRIEEGEVEKILAFHDEYDTLVQSFADMFTTVSFDELVVDTEPAIRKIAAFLGIDFHPNLLIASYNGVELECNGKKYIGKQNDKAEDLLSKEEIELIKKRIDAFKEAKTHADSHK
jgi:hypothetical protein